jgi:hypothetical protein
MLALFKKEQTRQITEDLNVELQELIKFGHPRISHLQGGWYCKVEMNTNTVGAKFDIDSGFDHPTPMSALKVCRERITNALNQLGYSV